MKNAVKGGLIHSQIREDDTDRAVPIDWERFLRGGEGFLNCARRLHMSPTPASRASSNKRAVRGSLVCNR
jgi:hypothetical protein